VRKEKKERILIHIPKVQKGGFDALRQFPTFVGIFSKKPQQKAVKEIQRGDTSQKGVVGARKKGFSRKDRR